MSTVTQDLKIEQLSREQKLQLIEALWESLQKDPAGIPVPDWHLEELERRMHLPDQQRGRPWPEVRASITGQS